MASVKFDIESSTVSCVQLKSREALFAEIFALPTCSWDVVSFRRRPSLQPVAVKFHQFPVQMRRFGAAAATFASFLVASAEGKTG